MSITTVVDTVKFAKQLRTRLAELRVEHAKAKKKYAGDIKAWRARLAEWLKSEGVRKALSGPLGADRYGNSNLIDCFFAGAPRRPEPPSDKPIRRVQGMLRHLGITGQAKVTVRTDEIAEYFTYDEGDE